MNTNFWIFYIIIETAHSFSDYVDPLWKVMLRTPSLSQHAFLTNKYNHLKKMRGWVTQNNNWKQKCIYIYTNEWILT